jgi:hypothetical protein
MSRSTVMRTLITALAITSFAAPAASARPDVIAKQSASQAHQAQDLQRRAGYAARTSNLSATSVAADPSGDTKYDLTGVTRGDDRRDEPSTRSVVIAHEGMSTTTIALGIAGCLVLIGGTVAVAGRSRLRTRRIAA